MGYSKRSLADGFTLIELMLVSAIIGLLAAIAIPKFGDLIIRAKEAAVLGKLGALRSAISIYYADTDGIVPGKGHPFSIPIGGVGQFVWLPGSLVPKYIDAIPSVSLPRHNYAFPPDTRETTPGFGACSGVVDSASVTIIGGTLNYTGPIRYYYNLATGRVTISCLFHYDSRGFQWSSR